MPEQLFIPGSIFLGLSNPITPYWSFHPGEYDFERSKAQLTTQLPLIRLARCAWVNAYLCERRSFERDLAGIANPCDLFRQVLEPQTFIIAWLNGEYVFEQSSVTREEAKRLIDVLRPTCHAVGIWGRRRAALYLYYALRRTFKDEPPA
jgi:hypothetical protein